jgi:hypothetical protein
LKFLLIIFNLSKLVYYLILHVYLSICNVVYFLKKALLEVIYHRLYEYIKISIVIFNNISLWIFLLLHYYMWYIIYMFIWSFRILLWYTIIVIFNYDIEQRNLRQLHVWQWIRSWLRLWKRWWDWIREESQNRCWYFSFQEHWSSRYLESWEN